jgi:hypothetical protein
LFATLPGVSAPPPFGGNQRTIVVTLDPDKLQQYKISPRGGDLGGQQVQRGDAVRQYVDRRNQPHCADQRSAGRNPAELLEHADPAGFRHHGLPARHRNHRERHRYHHRLRPRQREATVYIPVTKRADASTLAVISAVKAAIPDFKKAVPDDVDVRLEFDQSPFVTNSLRGLITEGLLGAASPA